jgi:RsiW-degrading membrane proteinase PrsW (M82 family)
MEPLLLLVLAIAPGAALLLFILRMDRLEAEPMGFLLKITALGAASCVPAIIVEMILGALPIFKAGGWTGAILVSFVQVAPIEELCKLGVVLLFVWKHRNFNEENDGIVYVGASALGFAMMENVFYVLDKGFATGVARALTALPLHCFTGVIMGYFVGLAKFAPGESARGLIIRGFLLAYLAHAVYDTLALSGSAAALLLVPLVAALVIAGLAYLKRGRLLSMKRWGGMKGIVERLKGVQAGKPTAAQTPAETEPAARALTPAPSAQKWKIVISRTLLTLSAIFWLLVIMGYLSSPPDKPLRLDDLVIGSVVLTFAPVLVGVLLEKSYRSGKRAAGAQKA